MWLNYLKTAYGLITDTHKIWYWKEIPNLPAYLGKNHKRCAALHATCLQVPSTNAKQTELTGYLRHDKEHVSPLQDDLDTFLAAAELASFTSIKHIIFV